jgi:NAD binding domain of 6-phosphogluconate dehydrogenase
MQLGMIGLGRMGANMARRLMRGGHQCVVYDLNPDNVQHLSHEGAAGAASLDEFVGGLSRPRAAWVMVPAGEPTERTVRMLADRFESGDIIIDGGNSFYKDDVRRAKTLRKTPHSQTIPDSCTIPAKGAGPFLPLSKRRSPLMCCQPRCMRVSVHARTIPLRRNCYRPCGINSAVMLSAQRGGNRLGRATDGNRRWERSEAIRTRSSDRAYVPSHELWGGGQRDR